MMKPTNLILALAVLFLIAMPASAALPTQIESCYPIAFGDDNETLFYYDYGTFKDADSINEHIELSYFEDGFLFTEGRDGNVTVTRYPSLQDYVDETNGYSQTFAWDSGDYDETLLFTNETDENDNIYFGVVLNSGNVTQLKVCEYNFHEFTVYTTTELNLDAFTESLLGATNLIQAIVEQVIYPPINTFYFLWIYVLQWVVALLAIIYAFKKASGAIHHVLNEGKEKRGR